MTKARDSAESSLASAQKQAEDQTRRLLEAKEQLQIAKEQILDLKKKLTEVEEAKNVAEWAKNEAQRAKEETMFARMEAECSKKKAEEEAYNLGVAETQATLKAQIPGYAGSIVPRSGMRPSSKLGLKPRPTCGRQSTCTIPLPSGKMPLPTPRSGMLRKRSRLLALGCSGNNFF